MIQKMDDLTKFCKPIQQAKHNGIEVAGCQAIKFDENDDGFVSSLDKKNHNNNVDYIEIIENGVILIELKDIKAKISSLFEEKPKNTKEIQKKLLSNVENKFTNSLSIIQKNINPNLMPTINYLVVANNTQNNLLDKYLPENLKKNPFVICKTNEICEKLSTLNTRLCQE